MSPAKFPEVNANYGPPSDLEESQCRTILAYRGQIEGGSCDGLDCVVVAYHVDEATLATLKRTGLIYFTMVGGLAPHYPSLSFHDATHPI
jgi:hypothetical protein